MTPPIKLPTQLDTRRVECPECGSDVLLELQHGFGATGDVHCPDCGEQITDDAKAVAMAKERLSVEEASKIALRYSYDEIMQIARTVFDKGARTSEEADVVYAFILLRDAGLPCCKPRRAQ